MPLSDGARDVGLADPQSNPGNAEEDHGGFLQLASTCACVTVFFAVLAVVFYFGPTHILRWMLGLLPRDPGWGWYTVMGVVTMISIVFIMPFWPPLCMAAGLIFGLWEGTVLNFFSIVGAAVLSIILGRIFLREHVRHYIEQGDHPELRRIMLVLEDSEDSLKFMVLFRFLFMPMFVRNYAPAALDIPLWKLCLATIPHGIWISLLFASLGASFKDAAELIRDGKEVSLKDMQWQQVLILVVSACIAIALAIYSQRKYAERVEMDEASAVKQADVLEHGSVQTNSCL